MKVNCNWQDKMNFVATANGFQIPMDAQTPFGEGKAVTPKELLLASLTGCTGMDVMGLMKKYKENLKHLNIDAEASIRKDHPQELVDITLNYQAEGECDKDKLLEAIRLSQTKYCPISSIISRSTEINYDVFLNGKKIGTGNAQFSDQPGSVKDAG